MKIEQLLVQHFYIAREVTLQGMGTFTLSPDFVMPKESDKELELPANAVSFQYNSRATEDEALIKYIVEQTRKMKSLASSDLESYLMLGKQFLNIGKPFKIEGLGYLTKNQIGEFQFTQGHTFHSNMPSAPAALKEQRENAEISFASESKPSGKNNKGLIITIIVIGLGLLAATAWYFLFKKNNHTEIVTPKTEINTDTIITAEAQPDSILPVNALPVKAADGYTFKVVFMVTADSMAAVSRMNIWTGRGHKIIMYKNDPLFYKLAEPFTNQLADTTHIKDSLNSYYYSGKAFIELK